MDNQLFEAALGIAEPWYVQGVDFDAAKKILTIGIDFTAGGRFAHEETSGLHPMYDAQVKRNRLLNVGQHECHLKVRTPRVKLPDGRVVPIEPAWAGKLSSFTLLFEAIVLALCQEIPFAAVARTVGEVWQRVRGDLPPAASVSRVMVDDTPPAAAARPRVAPAGGGCRLSFETLCTGDSRLQAAVEKARRIVGRDIPILIQGESGAGKEMFAKAFHNSGPRQTAPFVALNCAAIPENLIESELFGYRGGAFTGARKEGALGKIQQADGGTLFLDEIGDMPLSLQARLLRVLQERCVTPLGSSKPIPVDISLVCATHRRLREEVNAGNFREDLYYRLNGLCITLPALRERTDLRCLVTKLLAAETGGQRQVTVADDTMRIFESYAWPGNIRQLNNVLRVAIALLDEDETTITSHHLPEELLEIVRAPGAVAAGGDPANLEELGRRTILRVLEAEGGNITSAARRLGISRNTLYRRIGRL